MNNAHIDFPHFVNEKRKKNELNVLKFSKHVIDDQHMLCSLADYKNGLSTKENGLKKNSQLDDNIVLFV